MGVLLAAWKFAGEMFKIAFEAAAAFLKWVREHPKQALALAILIVAIVCTWWVTDWYVTKKVHAEDEKVIAALQAQVEKANRETKERDAKIARIEADSKVQADKFAADTKEANARMDKIVSEYTAKLNAEKKKNKVLIVKVPSGVPGSTATTDVPVEINQNNQVVCSRFHDAFTESVNQLVHEANTGGVK